LLNTGFGAYPPGWRLEVAVHRGNTGWPVTPYPSS